MDDVDSSICSNSESKTFRYVEINQKTYRRRGTEVSETKDMLFNFVLNIKAVVEDLEDSGFVVEEGGYIVELQFDEGKFTSFIPSTAWTSVERFLDSLNKYSKGLPTVFQQLTRFGLNCFGFDKAEAFKSHYRAINQALPCKKRVRKLGFQEDDSIFIIGQDSVFRKDERGAERLTLSDVGYIWTPGKPSFEVPVILRSDVEKNVMVVMKSVLPESTLLRFALTVGAVVMGLHYHCVMKKFKRCPTIVCVGDPNTGKTLCTSKSMDLLGFDASSRLEYKSISVAALRGQVFSQQNLPILLHDPSSPEVMKVLAEETYEFKAVSNCRERIVPGSSGLVTCNGDYLAEFRKLDGCVILPFTDEIADCTTRNVMELDRTKWMFASMLPRLLQFGEKEVEFISNKIDFVAPLIMAELVRYKHIDSPSRISFNIAMLYAFAMRAMEALLARDVFDESQLQAFVVKELSKAAVTWQTAPAPTKRSAEIPKTPASPSKTKSVEMGDHNEILLWLIQQFKPSLAELKRFITIGRDQTNTQFFAIREYEVKSLLASKGKDCSIFSNFRASVLRVEGYELSKGTRFPGDPSPRKATRLPLASISMSVQEALAGTSLSVEERFASLVQAAPPLTTDRNLESNEDEPLIVSTASVDQSMHCSSSSQGRFSSPPRVEVRINTNMTNAEHQNEGTLKQKRRSSSSESDDPIIQSAAPKFKSRIGCRLTPAEKPETTFCHSCNKTIKETTKRISCAGCHKQYHLGCQSLCSRKFAKVDQSAWRCNQCPGAHAAPAVADFSI